MSCARSPSRAAGRDPNTALRRSARRRCVVESGTSSYYSAIRDATDEPVLKEIAGRIAADEYRHYKLFYDTLHKQDEPDMPFWRKLWVAVTRVRESDDDELAYAYHCGNEPEGVEYDHKRCIAGYMSRAMGFYQWKHVERSTGMFPRRLPVV